MDRISKLVTQGADIVCHVAYYLLETCEDLTIILTCLGLAARALGL